MDRHQAPRVLRVRIECFDTLQRLPERRQDGADRVDLGLRRSGQGPAGAIQVGIEALDHLAVRQIGRGRGDVRSADGVKASSAATPIARPTAARKPNMPIGMNKPTTMVMMLIDQTATPTRLDAVAEVGVQPLPLAPRRIANRAVALIESAASTRIEPRDRSFDLVGYSQSFASIGVNGDVAPSSLPWFTPSARAI